MALGHLLDFFGLRAGEAARFQRSFRFSRFELLYLFSDTTSQQSSPGYFVYSGAPLSSFLSVVSSTLRWWWRWFGCGSLCPTDVVATAATTTTTSAAALAGTTIEARARAARLGEEISITIIKGKTNEDYSAVITQYIPNKHYLYSLRM